MSGERKPIILFDQVLGAAGATVHGDSFRVGGHALTVTLEHDIMPATGTFTLRGGPGKSSTHAIIFGQSATAGQVLLSAISTQAAANRVSWRILNAPMYLQVVIVEGDAAARLRVTAVVEVDQN